MRMARLSPVLLITTSDLWALSLALVVVEEALPNASVPEIQQ
jgi:hypothetical protein